MPRPALALVLTFVAASGLAGCSGFNPPHATPAVCPGGVPCLADTACQSGLAYTNVDATFRLCVPSGWSVAQNERGQEVFLFAPLESDRDYFQENINVGRQRVADNVTLQRYVADNLAAMPASLNEFQLTSRANVTAGGDPAVRLEFTHALYQTNATGAVVGRLALAGTQLLVVHDHVAAIVTYTAEGSKRAVFQAAAENVFASFRFT